MSATLKSDLFSTGIHGVTGQEVEEGELVAGTLIRNVQVDDEGEFPKWHFEASTDGGRLWYKQVAYAEPQV